MEDFKARERRFRRAVTAADRDLDRARRERVMREQAARRLSYLLETKRIDQARREGLL